MSGSPHLFVSLGTSPAIVPEAFLVPGANFSAVHVLTTDSAEVGFVQAWFSERASHVTLAITRVADFKDLRDEADHFNFEEILYRWVLETGTEAQQRWFCLSGGFKTMSAAVQKAAAVLGAAEVFHVVCDRPTDRQPGNADQIEAAAAGGHLHWIRLGLEAGWPQLRENNASSYPLEVASTAANVRRVRTPDQTFRRRLREVVERSHHIAGAWERLHNLPFTELATWPESHLTWLNGLLDPGAATDCSWLSRLPKVDLHCHLGGFATAGEDLEQVRLAAQEPAALPPLKSMVVPADWPLPGKCIDLEAYRSLGDNNGSTLLRDPGCLRRQCELLYAHLCRQHVLYAEIRCSPANYADSTRGRSPWQVLADIKEAFDHARNETVGMRSKDPAVPPPPRINLLLIGTRQATGDFRAGISRHLALGVAAAGHWTREDECRVVGVDLAGYEDKETRAHYFREEFTGIHRCGLALTVHAGENDDAEGVWRAVFDLNARRLGHALSLTESPDLLGSVTDRGIGIEMCPYANLQIRGFPLDDEALKTGSRAYPLLRYLRAGARVTVNTDNIGISGASLTDNLILAARLCPGLTRLHMLQLQRNAADLAFLPAAARFELIRRMASSLPQP